MSRLARRISAAASLVLLLVVGACAPGAQVLSPPTFRLAPSGSGFVRIDPPGVGAGTATFRLALTVENPNPVGVRLAGLDGDLYLRERRAAGASFRGGIDLPARGSAPLTLDVVVPLGAADDVLAAISALVGGAPLPYRLDAAVTVDVFGAPQRFPSFTLARGEVTGIPGLAAPKVELTGSSLRFVSVRNVEMRLDLRIVNGGILGYRAQAPTVVLVIGGAEAAAAGLSAVDVPAGSDANASLTFSFDPLGLGAALAAQVQAAAAGTGGLNVTLRGPWRLEAAGIATLGLEPAVLLQDVLR